MGRTPLKKNEINEKVYCRKCKQIKPESSFYTATDTFLDSNGFMSVCKDCINDIYDAFYNSNQNMEKTILEMCRLLNIRFDLGAVSATKAQIETYAEKGTKIQAIFGTYKSKLTASMPKGKIGDKDPVDLTFYEPNSEIVEEISVLEDGKDLEYFQETWGIGQDLDMNDYLYLENEYAKLIKTTKCDTYPEELFLRQICFVLNDIRKNREKGKSVDADIKVFQSMMKDGALRPADQNEKNSGKSSDSFGSWIKHIETMTPAEWYDDHEKFHDMEGMEEDLEDIKRSMKNFITGSRDFSSIDLEGIVNLNVESKSKKSSEEEPDVKEEKTEDINGTGD